MYQNLFRNHIKVLVTGMALSILPAIPFYTFTFEPTARQLSFLIPLFIPVVVILLIVDINLTRWYIKPLQPILKKLEEEFRLQEEEVFSSKVRLLNLPAMAVMRVFVPHALIGSGIYNILIILANNLFQLGMDPKTFYIYWIINLTVIPIAHAVYEFYSLPRITQPILESLEPFEKPLPDNWQKKLFKANIAVKLLLIFLMLGTAPLFILGFSTYTKNNNLILRDSGEQLHTEAQLVADGLQFIGESQRQDFLTNVFRDRSFMIIDSLRNSIFSNELLRTIDLKEVKQNLQGSEQNYFRMTNQKVLFGIGRNKETGTVVLMAAFEEKILSNTEPIRNWILIVILSSLGITLPLLYLVSTDIDRSTRKLLGGLEKVERGELESKVHIYSTDEFATIGNGFNKMIDGLVERDLVKDTFGKYVAPQVMETVLQRGVNLGGEKREVTVLISDIRNFTSRSERMDPTDVVHFLNSYLSAMVDIVYKYDGTLDKFIGDAILAVFGAPIAHDDDAERALLAALEMREALHHLNKTLQENGQQAIRIGIGINTGEVVAGNIGSSKRLEYTVIGDTVNLTSRIEELTKTFHTDILVSSSTYDRVRMKFSFGRRWKETVRGKTQEIEIYEVVSTLNHSSVA